MKKLMLILFLAILLVGSVSALNFLPIKQYDESTHTVTIVNTLGLGRYISTIQLKTNLTEVLSIGYQNVSMFEIELFDETYSNAFDKMEFYNKINMEKVYKQFDYKYLATEVFEVDDYDNVCKENLDCSLEIVGTHQEERKVWKDFDTKTLIKGKVIIGIFTYVYEYDNVEWIPTLFGKKINEWASYVQSSGTIHYIDIGGLNYTVHTFTSNGTFNVSTISLNVSVLVLGGGGGTKGTEYIGGGGGGGIYYNNSYYAFGNIAVTIGAGGNEVNGGNSSFGTLVGIGGGVGGWRNVDGEDGGCGGGSGGVDANQNGGSGLQGGDGGDVITSGNGASGGGGMSANGIAGWNEGAGSERGGAGGDGIAYDINGTSVYYAGGGGGGGKVVVASGGNGGGGDGGIYESTQATAGTDGLGGGGGGNFVGGGEDGGSGVVIIRYLTSDASIGPIVTLNTPINTANLTTNSVNFGGEVVSESASLITNVSLIINNIYNETNTSGINNSNYTFSKTLLDGDYTWTYEVCDNESLCVNATARTFNINTTPFIQFENPTQINEYNSSVSYVPINVSITETYFKNITFSFYNDTLTEFYYEDNTRFINESLADGIYSYNVTIWTTTDKSNSTETRNITIDTTLPFINITYPITKVDYHLPNTNLSLNWTVSDIHLDNCWYNYNGTNVSVTCSDNTTNINITTPNNRNITFWANDTFGHINSTFRSWDYKIFENSYIYNNETYEMETETFSINISSDGSEIIVGYLVYNGTSYIATKTGYNYLMEFNRTITLSQTGNLSFYWRFNYGGEILNSSIFNQSVNEIVVGICAGSLVTQTINFTAYDEEDLSREVPYDFYGSFNYWTGDGSITKNFSISNASVNDVTLCINVNETFHVNAQIQYEKTGFVKRSYYLVNEILTNSSQDIKLYFLNESQSTSFIIDITDEYQLPVEGAYVYVQRYHAGTDEFITVEIVLTDNSGSSISHFEIETEDYRVIIEIDGIIVFQSGQQKIFCRETPCALQFQIAAGEGISWEEFGVIDLFTWTLDYDETSEVWSFAYTDTSSSIGYGRLYVYYEEPHTGKTTICNVNSTLIADTLTCDVTGYNGTIYAEAYLSRSPEIFVYMKSIVIKTLKTIFGQEGLFMSMFILLVLALTGLWNPAVGIILIVVGMIILNMTGLASFGAVTLWGVVFIAGIILWKLKS